MLMKLITAAINTIDKPQNIIVVTADGNTIPVKKTMI